MFNAKLDTGAISQGEDRIKVTGLTPQLRVTTDDYNAQRNHPSINDVELIGDKKSHDLHLPDLEEHVHESERIPTPMTAQDILDICQ